MTSKKRILSLLILAALVVVLSTIPTFAAKPKLNRKSATVEAGKTVTLKVKGAKKVKWSSSNNQIAKIKSKTSNTAVVEGVSAGTAVIKAKIGGKTTLKCRVVVTGISNNNGASNNGSSNNGSTNNGSSTPGSVYNFDSFTELTITGPTLPTKVTYSRDGDTWEYMIEKIDVSEPVKRVNDISYPQRYDVTVTVTATVLHTEYGYAFIGYEVYHSSEYPAPYANSRAQSGQRGFDGPDGPIAVNVGDRIEFKIDIMLPMDNYRFVFPSTANY